MIKNDHSPPPAYRLHVRSELLEVGIAPAGPNADARARGNAHRRAPQRLLNIPDRMLLANLHRHWLFVQGLVEGPSVIDNFDGDDDGGRIVSGNGADVDTSNGNSDGSYETSIRISAIAILT